MSARGEIPGGMFMALRKELRSRVWTLSPLRMALWENIPVGSIGQVKRNRREQNSHGAGQDSMICATGRARLAATCAPRRLPTTQIDRAMARSPKKTRIIRPEISTTAAFRWEVSRPKADSPGNLRASPERHRTLPRGMQRVWLPRNSLLAGKMPGVACMPGP